MPDIARNSQPRHWLLLRGLTRESRHWGVFTAQLQSCFPEAKISTVDLPGTGAFHRQNSPQSISEILNVTRQQALDQGLLDRPVSLLGLSMGGMVVWEWLKHYPNDACGGVLVNSSFASLSPFYQRLRWQVYPDFLKLLTLSDIQQQERAILGLVSNQGLEELNSLAQHWINIRQQQPFTMQTAYHQLVAAARFKAGDKPIKPVLVVNSLGDRLVSPNCSQLIAHHYQLPIVTHPEAGHDLALDAGEWLAHQLYDWCNTVQE